MPGFDKVLSSEGRWDLVDYLRAHNAGESMRTTGKWTHPLPIPQFDITCANGRTLDLDDLRGRVLRIVAVSGNEAPAPSPTPGIDITTVILARRLTAGTGATNCVASEPETWTAFSILTGTASESLAGQQVLVDQNGWLRAAWRPGEPGDWTDPRVLAAVVRDTVAHPIAADAASGHMHHH
jgi:hypothetical protein